MAMQIKAKPQRYSFTDRAMTKDNQLAVCALTIKYLSQVKMDNWFDHYHYVKPAVARAIDSYVADQYLYDVTTDRTPPKELLKQLAEAVKTALKGPVKPTPTVKLEEITLTIKRDR
jgi:hypothetical protein